MTRLSRAIYGSAPVLVLGTHLSGYRSRSERRRQSWKPSGRWQWIARKSIAFGSLVVVWLRVNYEVSAKLLSVAANTQPPESTRATRPNHPNYPEHPRSSMTVSHRRNVVALFFSRPFACIICLALSFRSLSFYPLFSLV